MHLLFLSRREHVYYIFIIALFMVLGKVFQFSLWSPRGKIDMLHEWIIMMYVYIVQP